MDCLTRLVAGVADGSNWGLSADRKNFRQNTPIRWEGIRLYGLSIENRVGRPVLVIFKPQRMEGKQRQKKKTDLSSHMSFVVGHSSALTFPHGAGHHSASPTIRSYLTSLDRTPGFFASAGTDYSRICFVPAGLVAAWVEVVEVVVSFFVCFV